MESLEIFLIEIYWYLEIIIKKFSIYFNGNFINERHEFNTYEDKFYKISNGSVEFTDKGLLFNHEEIINDVVFYKNFSTISPQSAIKQLRDGFPDKYKFATDEEVYRIARNKYPDAPIQDWDKIGYKSIKPFHKKIFNSNQEYSIDLINFWRIKMNNDVYLSRDLN